MAEYTPKTIYELIKEIDDGRIILPAMQRNFVWSEDKICSLFESIMRDYPIGTFLFWMINENIFKKYVFNEFIRDYDEELGKMQRGKRATASFSDYTAVLDGQQRITSLYIGVKGKYRTHIKGKPWDKPESYVDRYLCVDILFTPGEEGEYITPTGAAIVAAVGTSQTLPESFIIRKIGLGAGKREYKRPGILRAMLIETQKKETKDVIWKLESDIDDCSGEVLGYIMDLLFQAGAREVHYVPVFMKKNRPAYEICVLCTEDLIPAMEEILFCETTTIGIRRQCMERTILNRENRRVETSYGEARVKLCELPGTNGVWRCYPEYDSVIALCKVSGLSYQDMYQQILKTWEEQ